MKITISDALENLKALKQRQAKLEEMRVENSSRERRYMGLGGDKTIEKTPVYNVAKLDKTINALAMEQRKLSVAVKAHNATSTLENYEWDDSLLGVIEME